jgi:tetratricopeptide (TPR) repeat protein
MKKYMPVLNIIRTCLLIGAGLLFFNISFGQSIQKENKKVIRKTDKILREAEKELSENDFASAEASYRQAVSKNPESLTARYNMANMYYGKEKPAQAATRYDQAGKIAGTKEEKHRIFHNMGNSFMDQKNYEGAVEAYKNALRNIPSDEETRYNLALAKKMLEKKKDDNKKDQNKDDKNKDKDKDKNKDKKEDKGDKDKDKKGGDDKEDKGGDKKDESKQEPEKPDDKGDPKDKKDKEEEKGDQGKEQQQQPQPGQLSAQQIKNLLEAMNNEEKKVQEKINAQETKGVPTRSGKDW